MSAYDTWLEAPYVNAARQEAEYEAWCEAHDKDPDTDHWEEFEQWCEAQMEARDEWHADQ